MTSISAPPSEVARAADLRRMQRRATALLLAVAGAFVGIVLVGDDAGWAGYFRAAAEGAMVGGLADWFAVTALFRHPLGLRIPHTAVIRERKDQFGATLGQFVQENFLTPEVLGERVRVAGVSRRLAAWLVVPENAALAARHAGDVVVGVAEAIRDEDVHRVLHGELERLAHAIPVASLSGRALRLATAEGRHDELLDAALRGVAAFLDDHREALRARFATEAPWWLPDALEDRIFDRLLDGVRARLDAVAHDPEHELRAAFARSVTELADRLEHDPALRDRGDQLREELLRHPDVRAWAGGVWTDLKARLRKEAGDPGSRLRASLAEVAVAAGHRLAEDAALREKVDGTAERTARYVAEHYRDEISHIITATIGRWDAAETSRKIELLLGRDLQFIRINGTVVGGLAGVVIHTAGQVLG